MHNEVLAFWFDEIEPKMCWVADPDFDQQIKDRFLHLWDRARQGEL